MTSVSQALEKIPSSCGHVVLNTDGSVVLSGGELANDEKVARTVYSMVMDAHQLTKQASRSKTFNRLSIVYSGFSLLVTVANQKVYIVKVRTIA
ncbi:ragulator complex protein LAMTOR4-like [Sycon ciliatum]|uniref:ragulator complex protein LAMTOR4-like n=1 Tax=Sycon ciliatum TaxID=27933 RepID=UPI0031F64810